VKIAATLGAEIMVLHIVTERERAKEGVQALSIFYKAGKNAGVSVNMMLREGDIVPSILECAEKESADLIIMGVSEGRVVAEWLSAGIFTRTKIPVLVIPHAIPKAMSLRKCLGTLG
jgi:nucleotide-binding universal stress UspA family protein